MAENDFEKTEAPTPRRRQEARQEGNVTRSADLSAACVLLGAVLMLYLWGRHLSDAMEITLRRMLSVDPGSNPTRGGDLGSIMAFGGRVMADAVVPFMLVITAVALVATIGQVGLLWSNKPLQPDLARLAPLRGLRNLVDVRAGVRLAMSMAKIVVIALLAVLVIMRDLSRIVMLSELEIRPMFGAAAMMVFWMALKLVLLLIVLAVIDYAFQRWKRERDLKMTKHDVKEEMKRMDGDPLIKQRRSRVARQLALQRIGQAVPNADMIVTNPTHYAVALRYDSATMTAPKVVAKGADYLAMRIRQLAMIHGVPMVERRELAQAMYKTVGVGQEVPPQFYGAVAEMLAYVYRLGGRRSA